MSVNLSFNESFVLVIEDTKDVSDVIAQFLVDTGHAVVQAREGNEALDIIRELGVPALVITDIFMPGMEGLETIIRLKQMSKSPKIIAVSDGGKYGRKDILRYAKNLGADYIVEKPINFDTLLSLVDDILRQPIQKKKQSL